MTTATREHPLLMSGPMVAATLADLKRQTRRVVKGAEKFLNIVSFERWVVDGEPQYRESGVPIWISREADGTCREWGCPYGEVGNRLWIRETFQPDLGKLIWYRADAALWDMERRVFTNYVAGDANLFWWKPSIHMPRWASRITLQIKGVRVERLQSITEEDARAEGIQRVTKDGDVFKFCVYDRGDHSSTAWADMPRTAADAYKELWNSINGKTHPWEQNSYVWVLDFERVK